MTGSRKAGRGVGAAESCGSVVLVSCVLVLGACSDGDPLSTREIQRAIGDLCADEVDIRAEDGPEAESGTWIEAASEGDEEAALAAAGYNAEAVGRMADEVADLEAEDDEDAAALDLAADGLDLRRATWEDRRDRHESSDEELDENVMVEMVEEGSSSLEDWIEALGHFDVVRRDCGAAVP